MTPRKTSTLTEAELRIMHVLWNKGRATVAEITEALKSEADLAYTTVLTMLQILERKGFLKHEKSGRAFIYEPIVAKSEASAAAVRDLANRFFNNSAELLVLNILENEKITSKELKRLKRLIEDKKEKT